jgi:NADH-quinone oxidoreductase subunit C
MDTAEIRELLTGRFGEAIVGGAHDNVDPWIEVLPRSLADVCRFLRDEPRLRFDVCNCVTAVDYSHADPKQASKAEWEPCLEVVYHLTSLKHRYRLVLKVKTPRWKEDRLGCLPEVPSISGIWRTAHWHEREVFDLSGVQFTGHPDLRRILCPEDWEGHPLRKDYEMPMEYHGIRNR